MIRNYLFHFLLTLMFTSALITGDLSTKPRLDIVEKIKNTQEKNNDFEGDVVLQFEKINPAEPLMGIVENVSGEIKKVGVIIPETGITDTLLFAICEDVGQDKKFELVGAVAVIPGQPLLIMPKKSILKNSKILVLSLNAPVGTKFFILIKENKIKT
ncbi:MAG: hypothetical protein AMQ22_00193 [Candidatus Methanofastidiosum methylothiophilum]|uniref:Uncharacterized protein n=1 Tax=Candidatus Methanofastidiosum methylothiophilum TaxID=1705564 RepID=A0A150J8F4_9EURY|nr:MAG: hypothetical protein APG11_00848 [Candidatus Methanofastidiosum methylthiophilus]KYC53522.1 MAG: hypothetical protein AMQ22_00193 [Candidatus Methanofastidiosum methylthiophilus]